MGERVFIAVLLKGFLRFRVMLKNMQTRAYTGVSLKEEALKFNVV